MLEEVGGGALEEVEGGPSEVGNALEDVDDELFDDVGGGLLEELEGWASGDVGGVLDDVGEES